LKSLAPKIFPTLIKSGEALGLKEEA
jgi:hypothetical protein